ncbi:hypothetical protein F2P56_031949 [Juglans regia]|uniref:Xyloglucan endotransglucosylase/hydrolase n=2 Tax=Juglans regia TaxID=51240 RepID=A0A6P9E1M1_JUGRE|nr:xyloglucan endotransglucosylase/hydrolase protein 2-like [Juglans regia]KAF5446313.1 hypothetical protein F2P56_031949 [Juglans regia]
MDLFLLICLLVFLLAAAGQSSTAARPDVPWSQNYAILYGQDHTQSLNQGKEIQLSIDQVSGSGFRSLKTYGSGIFSMRIMLPPGDSTSIITTFYLRSYTNNHDEIDFEFLGNSTLPYLLQTNIFTNGQGSREQRINLWFDPTKDFHDYHVLWNQHQVVWLVDGVPIRVFENMENIGVKFPVQAMQIEATMWTAPWASPHGKPPNWGQGPFRAYYQGFNIDGCVAENNTIATPCFGSNSWWNGKNYWKLNPKQLQEYLGVRKKYLVYDYCIHRHGSKPPECNIH